MTECVSRIVEIEEVQTNAEIPKKTLTIRELVRFKLLFGIKLFRSACDY